MKALTRAALHAIVNGIGAGAADKLWLRGEEEYAARASATRRSPPRACTCLATMTSATARPKKNTRWTGSRGAHRRCREAPGWIISAQWPPRRLQPSPDPFRLTLRL